MESYDILIIGAGIAGLHCALCLSKDDHSLKIAIAEAYNYVGGRVLSYKVPWGPEVPQGPDIHWENGAGRIHSSHTIILDYIHHYGLNLIPLAKGSQDWRTPLEAKGTPNIWPSLSLLLVEALTNIKPSILASHTIAQIIDNKEIMNRFSFRSELFTMRADLAIKSLEHEMGETEGEFYVVKEGLSALIRHMRSDLEKRGVNFFLNHRATTVQKDTAQFHSKPSIKADKIILALHASALRKIGPFQNLPVLKYLKMEPLLRTYGVFPLGLGKGQGKGPWFQDIHHTVTNSPLRSIIPINPKQGTIMTSYTDGDDTKEYLKILKKSPKLLENRIMKDLRSLFSELEIPDPLFFKAHPWHDGCTYWLPGRYNPKEESEKILNPFPSRFPNVFVCGESFSMRQAWMEGALEHAEQLLDRFFS